MKVAVTGHTGYIGATLVPMLLEAGHEVLGIDSGLFDACEPLEPLADVPAIARDIRDLEAADLAGCDAVVHLAAVSNDPMGELNPDTTYSINHRGTVHAAEQARRAGVGRFLFSSSCSLYGAAATDDAVTEESPFNPVSAYGKAKMLAERDLSALADDGFSPVHLRNATAYGLTARLRTDLVVNDLTASAVATGEVRLLSDGTPWRPLIHAEDISRAFLALLDAPREVVHDEAFNVGRSDANYRIREVAEIVGEVVAGSEVTVSPEAGPDTRSYRVSFDKIQRLVPGFAPRWTVRDAVAELRDVFTERGFTREELSAPRFVRLQALRSLMGDGRLDDELRWRATV